VVESLALAGVWVCDAGDARHDTSLEQQPRQERQSSVAEGLATFRRVDRREPHAHPLPPAGELPDVVTIANGDDKHQAATGDEPPRSAGPLR